MRRSEATATGVKVIAEAITSQGGRDAVSMHLAQQYVDAFGKIARTGNTMIVPADAGNVASMIATAAGVFRGSTAIDAGGGGPATSGGGGAGSGDSDANKAGDEAEVQVKPPLGSRVLDDTMIGLATGQSGGGGAGRDLADGAGVDEAFLRTWVQGGGQGVGPAQGGFSLSK